MSAFRRILRRISGDCESSVHVPPGSIIEDVQVAIAFSCFSSLGIFTVLQILAILS
jgi:hypothetical protein